MFMSVVKLSHIQKVIFEFSLIFKVWIVSKRRSDI